MQPADSSLQSKISLPVLVAAATVADSRRSSLFRLFLLNLDVQSSPKCRIYGVDQFILRTQIDQRRQLFHIVIYVVNVGLFPCFSKDS
jgi:hypothetical protein